MSDVAFIEGQCLHVHEMIAQDGRPYRQVWAAAIVRLSREGIVGEDFAPLMTFGGELGASLGQRASAALQRTDREPLSYGKGALVGSACRIEHAAAILHPQLGKSLRAIFGAGPAIIPSTVKHAAVGARLDIPLHGAADEWNFSLLDAVEVCAGNAPLPEQIVIVVALAAGQRSSIFDRKS